MSEVMSVDDMDPLEDIQAMVNNISYDLSDDLSLSDECDDDSGMENAEENHPKNGEDQGEKKQDSPVESGDYDRDSATKADNSSQGSSDANNTLDLTKFQEAQSQDMTNEKVKNDVEVSKDSLIKKDTNEQESQTQKHVMEDVNTGAPPTKKLKGENIEAIRNDQDKLLNQKHDNENVESEIEFLDNLKALNGTEFLSDLVIVSEGVKYACHKIVLASRSDVLKDIIALRTHEKDDHLKITEASPEIVKHLLNHIYTGEIPKEIDEVASELYKLALKYNMKALTKACENSLLAHITDENVLEFLVSVDKNKSSIHIKEYVIKYIASNATKIMAMEKFAMISKELMIEIMHCLENKCRELANQNKATLTGMKNGKPVCDLIKTVENDNQAGNETDELLVNKVKWQEEYEKDMKALYGQSSLSDFTLLCGDEKFLCHKVVLASRSDVLKQIIEKESFNDQWEINDISLDVSELLVKHIYTGEIPKNLDNVATELFLLAAKYKMKILSKACENNMMSQLNTENALKVLVAVNMANSSLSAKDDVIEFIASNADEILDKQEYRTFWKEQPELIILIFQKLAAIKSGKKIK